MASDLGKLKTDSLFLGLTRSPMLFGVSYTFFGLNAIASLMYFVLTNDFKVILFASIIHGIGYVLNKKEPLAVEIMMTKLQKFNKCKNKFFYSGLNSYNQFSN